MHTDSAGEEKKKDPADTHEAVCGSDDTPKDCIGLQRACHNFCYVAGHAFYFAGLNKCLKMVQVTAAAELPLNISLV